jgi:D-threonate/D-erythronate kinase
MNVVVIADDLSGAAELATAAADLGHSSEVQTRFDSTCGAEVIAVDTDTRALSAPEAAQTVEAVSREVVAAGVKWIYKKADSVLRGNVRAEIEAVMKATGIGRALLIPANPSKGRVVRDGIYYVDGVPLAQSSFAADPSHPCRSSNVSELLEASGSICVSRSVDLSDQSFNGIMVPDIDDTRDIQRSAADLDALILPAGGVEYFSAMLRSRLGAPSVFAAQECQKPLLFVCGSRMAWEQGRAEECRRWNLPVLLMPQSLHWAAHCSAAAEWSQEVIRTLAQCGWAMAAVGSASDQQSSSALANRLAEVIVQLLRRHAVATVCIEGGATAAALLRHLQWTRLTALPAPGLAGVAILQPIGASSPQILIKPGSYPWPQKLWRTCL